MYNYCVSDISDICNFMLIQKSAPQNKNYRKNFDTILNPDNFK